MSDSNNTGIPDGLREPDGDSLTNIQEQNNSTNPTQPDTDEDGLSDGWEVKYGYSALINNKTDTNPTNNPEADPDGDGLNNSREDQIGTSPANADTDGDSFSDFVENQAGSNATGGSSTPSNPGGVTGGSSPPPPPPIIPVIMNFGDHSGSHSGKYRVCLEPLEGDANAITRFRMNSNYGQVQSENLFLPAGAKYKVTLDHIDTDPEYEGEPKPDYDYT